MSNVTPPCFRERTQSCDRLAPARNLEGRTGDTRSVAARTAVLAVAGSASRNPEKPAPVHHRLHRRPGCASQPEHGAQRPDRPQPATDRRTTAKRRRTAGAAAQTAKIVARPAQPGVAQPLRKNPQRQRRQQRGRRLPERTGPAQPRPGPLFQQRRSTVRWCICCCIKPAAAPAATGSCA